jgi:uncharacterized protein (TIGR02246 family)
MPTDTEQIQTLIERWAKAVHAGDLDGVLADHAEDIVMFDVPPPYEGVLGIDAYRETWPPFFEWQRQGASFEIESLDVTAGVDVAFAHALLRCGTPQEFADRPENRLRLTLGLRKEDGRWVVVHEHHSFPHTGVDGDTGVGGDTSVDGDTGVDGDTDVGGVTDETSVNRTDSQHGGAEGEIRQLHQRWFEGTVAKDPTA